MTFTTPLQVFEASRPLIANHWTINVMADFRGNFCAMGALAEATGRLNYFVDQPTRQAHDEAVKILADLISDKEALGPNADYYGGPGCYRDVRNADCRVASFNNTNHHDVVLAKWDQAIAMLRSEAEAARQPTVHQTQVIDTLLHAAAAPTRELEPA